ncbi:hypothetical protein NQ314_014196 [Rhamnusium bicolor]|uniref:PiggyBac transposable element-derived protein domain-containing protein n=1 Tax=Rhamnusium bicolor TaxID=1586634 RepID=A0AAV8X2G0_9CUCU|nr:hypothetical protein NQ314_014196 [Rhamnusium bicolor]
MLMGLPNFPTIESYWISDPLYYHELFQKLPIKYHRFALLLRCWHFQDNSISGINHLSKINPLLKLIRKNMNNIYAPGDTIVIDETMVPFRDRLKFPQYNPSKAHKYGIKLYKLCTLHGYAWDVKIYDGQGQRLAELDLLGSTVIELVKPFLDDGRLVITDNYYTSIDLAKYLYDRKTNLLGTIRKNRIDLPRDLINYKLRKGKVVFKQNDYITFIKWKDQ